MLNEDENSKIFSCMKNKVTKTNVLVIYSLAKFYKLATFSELSLLYIERCFPMVIETQNFLHLDFSNLAKILASSDLNIHSEVEIFNAVITWLKHNNEECSKYAKQLLLKVRLALLSEHALIYVIDKISSITDNCERVNILKEILADKNYFQNKSKSYYTSRYCNQNNFNLLICGSYLSWLNGVENKIEQIDGSNLNKVKDLVPINKHRTYFEAVCLKGEVYILGGYDYADKLIHTVEKYSLSTNEWTVVTNIFDDRESFCCCAFVDEIFILGGFSYTDDDGYISNKSCLKFDTRDKNWKEISAMTVERDCAACTVFQGNIVVSGGTDNVDNELKSVESYDVFADNWSQMPDMINNHKFHSSVVVKNKLFIMDDGKNNCEVFDNVCKKFVTLKSSYTLDLNKAISIGNKIIVFQEFSLSVISYDVDKDKWSKESCEVTEYLELFSCVKIPQY